MNRALAVLCFSVFACAQPPGTSAGGNADALTHVAKRGRWTPLSAPTQSVITGGPWTLEQEGASLSVPSAGYCVAGVQQGNDGTERMSPYYFPLTIGRGLHLQGYFDWRPKDDDEAIVAASSDDAGRSWTFQQKALELTTVCPATDAGNNGGDDGMGHPMVMTVGGVTRLYVLDRSAGNVDSAGMVIHVIAGAGDTPLDGATAAAQVPARTDGLLDPDGILALVPGQNPATVLYLQKTLGGAASFPAAQQCADKSPNQDLTQVRVATTDDGVHFTDLGPVSGLNDPTDASPDGTRFVGPRGSVLLFADGRYGLFFSGGSCLDNDADAFHYLGYAESDDLFHWRVIHSMNNPLASTKRVTATDAAGNSITIPASDPVLQTQGWFSGRVYGPSATIEDDNTIALAFAGYHTKKPKGSFGDYRNVGRVALESSLRLVAGSGDGE